MKFITDHNELSEVFTQLCNRYRHYKWAVAWAGDVHGFDHANLLKRFEQKINKIVVGLHFYQTAPSFIEQYISNKAVRFLYQTDGTFHSKIYLFYDSEKEWSALVGSSNFTNSGFHNNEEANILLTQNDGVGVFSQISTYIDKLWDEGKYFSTEELKAYKDSCKYQKRNLKSLSSLNNHSKPYMTSSIDVKNWGDYVAEVISQDSHNTHERVRLLSKARELFKTYKQFDQMPLNVRKCLAGFESTMNDYDGESIDWKFFGSMQGAGTYKHAIIEKIKIGRALDTIPLTGSISKVQFDAYCKAFDNWSNPLACATRLLAIKRPDWFVCIDSKNRRELSLMMKVPQSRLTLQNYWEEVVMRVQNSIWYNDDSRKEEGIETDIWNYRVAMLDCLCYKED